MDILPASEIAQFDPAQGVPSWAAAAIDVGPSVMEPCFAPFEGAGGSGLEPVLFTGGIDPVLLDVSLPFGNTTEPSGDDPIIGALAFCWLIPPVDCEPAFVVESPDLDWSNFAPGAPESTGAEEDPVAQGEFSKGDWVATVEPYLVADPYLVDIEIEVVKSETAEPADQEAVQITNDRDFSEGVYIRCGTTMTVPLPWWRGAGLGELDRAPAAVTSIAADVGPLIPLESAMSEMTAQLESASRLDAAAKEDAQAEPVVVEYSWYKGFPYSPELATAPVAPGGPESDGAGLPLSSNEALAPSIAAASVDEGRAESDILGELCRYGDYGDAALNLDFGSGRIANLRYRTARYLQSPQQ